MNSTVSDCYGMLYDPIIIIIVKPIGVRLRLVFLVLDFLWPPCRSVLEGLRYLHSHDVAHGAIRGPEHGHHMGSEIHQCSIWGMAGVDHIDLP